MKAREMCNKNDTTFTFFLASTDNSSIWIGVGVGSATFIIIIIIIVLVVIIKIRKSTSGQSKETSESNELSNYTDLSPHTPSDYAKLNLHGEQTTLGADDADNEGIDPYDTIPADLTEPKHVYGNIDD